MLKMCKFFIFTFYFTIKMLIFSTISGKNGTIETPKIHIGCHEEGAGVLNEEYKKLGGLMDGVVGGIATLVMIIKIEEYINWMRYIRTTITILEQDDKYRGKFRWTWTVRYENPRGWLDVCGSYGGAENARCVKSGGFCRSIADPFELARPVIQTRRAVLECELCKRGEGSESIRDYSNEPSWSVFAELEGVVGSPYAHF